MGKIAPEARDHGDKDDEVFAKEIAQPSQRAISESGVIIGAGLEAPFESEDVASSSGGEPSVVDDHGDEFGGGSQDSENKPGGGIEGAGDFGGGTPGADADPDVEQQIRHVVADRVEPLPAHTELVANSCKLSIYAVDNGVELVEESGGEKAKISAEGGGDGRSYAEQEGHCCDVVGSNGSGSQSTADGEAEVTVEVLGHNAVFGLATAIPEASLCSSYRLMRIDGDCPPSGEISTRVKAVFEVLCVYFLRLMVGGKSFDGEVTLSCACRRLRCLIFEIMQDALDVGAVKDGLGIQKDYDVGTNGGPKGGVGRYLMYGDVRGSSVQLGKGTGVGGEEQNFAGAAENSQAQGALQKR